MEDAGLVHRGEKMGMWEKLWNHLKSIELMDLPAPVPMWSGGLVAIALTRWLL